MMLPGIKASLARGGLLQRGVAGGLQAACCSASIFCRSGGSPSSGLQDAWNCVQCGGLRWGGGEKGAGTEGHLLGGSLSSRTKVPLVFCWEPQRCSPLSRPRRQKDAGRVLGALYRAVPSGFLAAGGQAACPPRAAKPHVASPPW